MTLFWVGAAALALVALGFLLLPLWRQRCDSGEWSIAGVIAVALLLPLSIGLYVNVSTWDGEAVGGDGAAAIGDLVGQLALRLSEQPEDVAGWRLLGQTFTQLGRYPEALEAFREVWGRTPEPDTALKVAIAEVLAFIDPVTLQGEAGQLIDEVLAVEPRNEKALWYGGLAAIQGGNATLASQRWAALIELGVPPEIESILREQVAAIDSGGQASAAVSAPAEVDGYALALRVLLGDMVELPDFGPGSALFIFARSPEGGPPLAVIRESVTSVPGEFVLSDAQAMLPGRSLADFPTLSVVARLSLSGEPTAQSGDLFGEVEISPSGDSVTADLVIDQITP